jgi:serine/threonine protein kinase
MTDVSFQDDTESFYAESFVSDSFTDTNSQGSGGSRQYNNKYSIIKQIGQGSFGTVYLVNDIKDQKEYALKEVRCSTDEELNK